MADRAERARNYRAMADKAKDPFVKNMYLEWAWNTERGLTRLGRVREQVNTERNAEIIRLRSAGATLEIIGQKFKMTRERVRQIVKAADVRNGTKIASTAKLVSSAVRSDANRVDVPCVVCGDIMRLQKSSKRRWHSVGCSVVGRRRVALERSALYRRAFSDDLLRQIIALREAGGTWRAIAENVRHGLQSVQAQAAVYAYLARENQLTHTKVADLFLGNATGVNGINYVGRSYASFAARFGYPSESGIPDLHARYRRSEKRQNGRKRLHDTASNRRHP